MRWFNRKPRDLIADSNAEWEQIRAIEQPELTEDPMIRDLREVAQNNLIAAGGWCAPSEPSYFLHDLPAVNQGRYLHG